MDELTSQSATRLAHLIRTRAVSPVEVVEAHLRRIERLNPALNAVVTVARDAIDQARAAEAMLMRGGHVGPLHGVPLTIKDTIFTRGMLTTSGSLMRKSVRRNDAPAVALLRAAGAIILGKTNCAEMAMDYTADNPVFGRTNNPYDMSRTPGGSSGGEAAAIAACMSPAGLGSDLAGSIRVPSHFCGIVGLKPTIERVPAGGQYPPATGAYAWGSTIGPMARSVEDLHLLLFVLAERKAREAAFARELALSAFTGHTVTQSQPFATLNDARASLQGARVAFYTDDGIAPVTQETCKAVETAARALTDAGLHVEAERPPGVERGHELWLRLFSHASVLQLRKTYGGHEEKAGAFVRWRLEDAANRIPPGDGDDLIAFLKAVHLKLALIDWMKQTPLVIAPVGSTPAFLHDQHKITVGDQTLSTFRAFSYAQAFNVFDLPVAVVPAGKSETGLPIGVQIIGRPFAEDAVLAAAAIIEEALGGWRMPELAQL